MVELANGKSVPSRRPRVLVLSFSPIVRDPRVLRQIRLLSEIADIVSCGYGEAPRGVVEHVQIPDDLKAWRKDFKSTATLLAMRFYERLYFDSERIKFVRRAIPTGSVDVIIANDVIAVPLALALRPARGVHADLHEYAPRQGEDRLQWKLLIGPFMHWAARRYVTRADSVTTVAKGIAEEYARVYGIPEPLVVPNASSYDGRYSPTEVQIPLRLIHTGAAGRGRKIEVMIDAVARANEIRPGTATLDLVMVPGEQKYIDELTARAAAVSNNAVRMKSAVPFDQIVPMLQNYDVGIFICPPSTFNLLHALPNKLFEFIQARLAVVIGPSPEMERIVRQYGVGAVSKDFSAESIAQLLMDLTPEAVADMKLASHRAARELSAEEVMGPWTDAVRKLLRAVA